MEILLSTKSASRNVALPEPQDRNVKRKRCLIVHPGDIALEFIKEPELARSYIVDFWDGSNSVDLATTLVSANYDIVLLDPSSKVALDKVQLKYINDLRVNQVSVYNLASFHEKFTRKIPLAHFKSWLINSDMFFVSSRQAFMIQKRAIDIFVSLLLAPIVILLVLLAIACIKCTSEGPAFFVQKRVGMCGRTFKILKLRTMYHTPNTLDDRYTVTNDLRITPLGKILRKTKIDELPQFFNILCGHMSLIGPRPEREEIVARLVEDAPYYNLRHSIRPGVTGWAQVNYPTATPEHNMLKLEYDLFYVKNASLALDLKIFIKTIKVVLTLDSM